MKLDEILTQIGEFGRFQTLVYTLVCITSALSAMVAFSQVFTSVSVDHWCAVSEWSDDVEECERKNQSLYLSCIQKLRDSSIPLEGGETEVYSKCSRYDTDYPQDLYEGYFAGNVTNNTSSCKDGWVYDRSQYDSSAVMEFDLVGDRSYLPDVEQAIYYTGYFIGSFVLGTKSDKFGRFKAYYISVTGVCIAGFLIAISPTYWFYTSVRFVQGSLNMVYGLAFTIAIEIVGPSKRALAGTIICLFYSVGYMLLAVLAYFITDWRLFKITISSCFLLCYLYVTILPESIRWLISQKQYKKGKKLILKAARFNRKSDKLQPDFMDELKREEEEEEEEEEVAEKQKIIESPYVQDLFRTRSLRLNTLNIAFQWVVNAMVYYGISLSTSSLGSNDSIAFFISGAVEIPAYLLCIPAMGSVLGRRGSTVIFEVIAGIACVSTAFIPLGTWRVAAGMLGKFCISTSYAVIYIYAAELFPTPVRAVGIAVCTTASNLAAITSSLVLILEQVWTPLPYLVLDSVSFVGGWIALFLPETRGKPLLEVLESNGEHTTTVK